MAPQRTTRHALASYEWIKDERHQANEETVKHVEDFGYSVTHELEWLNEKMAEVFNGDAKTLTDIFKTPGRLRNKTPRTLRKPVAATGQTPRVPLGDVFASTLNGTPILSPRLELANTSPFRVAEDVENRNPSPPKSSSRSKSPQRAGQPGNIDSGYHGMTEDEMEHENAVKSQLKEHLDTKSVNDDSAQSGEDSFESARRERYHTAEPTQQSEEEEAFVPLDAEDDTVVLGVAGDDTVPYSPASLHEAHKVALNRKSSFNFSSLPAREPLLAKKSIGPSQSNMAGGRVAPKNSASPLDDNMNAAPLDQGKTSTQLLHERITLLGQGKGSSRLSKSTSQPILYPQLTTSEEDSAPPQSQPAEAVVEPNHLDAQFSKSFVDKPRPQSVMVQPTARPISMMSFNSIQDNSTPTGSPSSKKQYDGPLSASKNRLMSVLKSARSIFASSASASAAAKLEAHTTTPSRPSPSREVSHDSVEAAVFTMPGALQSGTSLARTLSRPISIISSSPSRKFRDSDESERLREKELKAQEKAAQELERARERERLKVVKEQEERIKTEKAEIARQEKEAQRIAKAQEKEASGRVAATTTGKLRSIVRPARPTPGTAKVLQSVNVKTTSQAQNEATTTTTLPRPTSAPRPSSAYGSVKPPTIAPNRPASRALEAAARKKELEQKDKLRREQQKKELERKRAAKQAETDRKAVEAARIAQEAKLAAEQAAAAKRQEQAKIESEQRRLLEAQRQQEEVQRQKAAHDLAETIARERAHQQHATGTIRQLGQKGYEQPRPPVNTAKPAKRPHNDEPEDAAAQQRVGTYQQNDGKRRKTGEEADNHSRPSVMGPPMRPSTIRKETLSRFPMGYTQAASSQAQPTLFKAVPQYTQQPNRPTHPNQTVQMSNARIAFAETSVKASVATAVTSGHADSGKFKTPVRAVQTTVKSAVKSSPMYPNGDSIALPEINTDSEDEEDDDDDNDGFRAPSWVTSPALRDLLTQQQLVDPESVFGPIGELKMEEVFKNNKNPERLKKFRDRGSSAAWVQNGDAVTSAEKRRDMELRERVARDGGWRYQPGL